MSTVSWLGEKPLTGALSLTHLGRPAARCWCCHRSVSAGRSPNPPCVFQRNGLSTVIDPLPSSNPGRLYFCAPVAIAGNAYRGGVIQSGPLSADRLPPASMVGEPPAYLAPPPAVQLLLP